MSVFHLKYRPQNFSDLDLSEVSVTLKNILKSKDVPQCYLFSGPKGAGKTSAARILAKAINCTDLKDGEPCGKCENCLEVIKGNSMDVIEMDAASNRGIEDIRSLKDKVNLLPSKLPKKVFIIDEVHMLTKEAFNAMLKLIEEPPVHTIFILCTTDEEKIPETVLSRLMKVGFHKGSQKELLKSLKRIIEGEGMEVEDKVLEMVAEKSDGSFRNLQKTFNEIVLQCGKKITAKDVEDFFNSRFGEYRAIELETDMAAGDVKLILAKLEKIAEKGIDFKGYREELMEYFQGKLLAALGVLGSEKSKLKPEDLERWLVLLINAGKQEKEITIAQLPLELAIAEFFGIKGTAPVAKKVEESKEETEIVIPSEVEEKADVVMEIEETVTLVGADFGIEKIEAEWGNILNTVKPINHSVEAFLRAARPKSIKGKTVVLEVFYPFHKDKLEEQKNRQLVEKGLKKVLGADLIFECVLGKTKQKPLVINNETPVESVSEVLAGEEKKSSGENGDIYDVAKQIFG